ncbi:MULTISPECIES: hypothetical protein [Stenotrophomonas maltophilia group]|uniref:Uncharacterized protein n=1 Tax=Stenotrophomonas maltophilia TaxID=40324 RepID=A0A246ICK3_STEMA|nr:MULTISPECIES: hypothetical protein [Stenotrophomonas maltophilia group]MCZ7844401.1 hypothetical protein [Stenotrophomonas maltophilia]MDJ1624459.1 hypothetical protein [Stenotrophomonas sepilia]OWQ77550.1 hypothetical protein CEE63_03840 [Stenotrophomonas maltophilia]PZT35340.1 hypothetical protein A7X97_00845 [Stenotrophomonas sepilia]
MKNRITHVAVMSLVLTAVVPGEVVAQQQRSYDRFKDRTSYEAKVELSELSKTSRGISLSLQSVVDGDRAVTKLDSFTVSAIVTFNMSYDVRCAGTGFDMLVDGRAVSLPSDMPAFNRYEYAILSFGKKMTLAEAGAFARANRIEVRVCDTEYSLDDEQRAALRDLVKDAQISSSTGG